MIENRRLGFSIVEVMVAVGLMSIVSLGLMSMMTSQQRLMKAIDEKMLTKDVETQINNVLTNSNYCNCLFRGHTLRTSVTPAIWNTFPASLPISYSQPPPAPPTACTGIGTMVPAVGGTLQGSQIRILNIRMTNIANQGSGNYTGTLEVNFNPGSMVRAIRNLSMSTSFSVNTTDPPAARRFVSCGASSASGLVFLPTPISVSTSALNPGDGNSGWRTFNFSALVPAGTTVVILEHNLRNFWRVGGIESKYRRSATSPVTEELWIGRTLDDDSQGADAGQGFFSLNTATNTLQFRIDAWGSGGSWEIKMIGYFAP